jgi:hypothetical protein
MGSVSLRKAGFGGIEVASYIPSNRAAGDPKLTQQQVSSLYPCEARGTVGNVPP